MEISIEEALNLLQQELENYTTGKSILNVFDEYMIESIATLCHAARMSVKYKEALEFYADAKTYKIHSQRAVGKGGVYKNIDRDQGKKAREALKLDGD